MKNRNIFLGVLLCVSLLFCVSCGNADGGYYYGDDSGSIYASEIAYNKKISELKTDGERKGDAPDSGNDLASRKIIKTVSENVETDDYDGFMSTLNFLLASCGGFVDEAEYYGGKTLTYDSLSRAELTLRIPADKLSQFTESVGEEAYVTSYKESKEDVTMTYVDTASRIAVLEAEELALETMLGSATTISDMMLIRNQLTSVQSDLAALRGVINRYDDLISYSTVYMTVREVRRATPKDPNFFTDVGETFMTAVSDIGDGLYDFGVWFFGNILHIVLWGGVVTGGVFAVRAVVRKRKEKKTPSDKQQ